MLLCGRYLLGTVTIHLASTVPQKAAQSCLQELVWTSGSYTLQLLASSFVCERQHGMSVLGLSDNILRVKPPTLLCVPCCCLQSPPLASASPSSQNCSSVCSLQLHLEGRAVIHGTYLLHLG